jgi:uncharacterized protein YqeY
MDGLRDRLRDALKAAMRARDDVSRAAFRSALSVIDNAEAADLHDAPPEQAGVIAGGVAGLGAGEVARKQLSDEQLVQILHAEIARWESTARDAERAGRIDDAMRLRAEIAALRPLLNV